MRLQVCLESKTRSNSGGMWWQWSSAQCDTRHNPCCPEHGLAFSTASCAASGAAKGVGFMAVGELR
jgi:hypothetical protein